MRCSYAQQHIHASLEQSQQTASRRFFTPPEILAIFALFVCYWHLYGRLVARRSDIDWEAVERDYRAGSLSIVAVSEKHGVSRTHLKAKAKAEGWLRDLSAAIAQRTQAKISAIDVAALVEQSATQAANQSARTIQSAIEQASDVAAGVVIKHRASIRLEHERALAIEALLDNAMGNAVEVKDIATVAQTYKMLVDSKSKLRDQERTVFGLDKAESNEGNAADEIRKAIADYKRSKGE